MARGQRLTSVQEGSVTNYDLFWGASKQAGCLLSVASATFVDDNKIRIALKASEPPAVYPNAKVMGYPTTKVMKGEFRNVSLLAASTLVGIDGTVLLGRRPGSDLVTGYPNHLTLFGGRCSENPVMTFDKELLEELFIEIPSSGEAIDLAPFDSASLRVITTTSARQCGQNNPKWRKPIIAPMSEFTCYCVEIELYTNESNKGIRIVLPNTGCFYDPSMNTYELIRGITLSLPDNVSLGDLRAQFLENPKHTLEQDTPDRFLGDELTFTARTALSIISPDLYGTTEPSVASKRRMAAVR